jgi:molybdenum cofactor guanylyltransferase
MASPIRHLRFMMLAAGKSSRIGSPKFLLPLPDGRPSYVHGVEMLQRAFPDAENIWLWLRDPSQLMADEVPGSLNVKLFYETVHVDHSHLKNARGLPVNGLLAAFEIDPTCHWLFIPCDYPLLTMEELRHLRVQYTEPVTCFENGRGLTERWVSIWGPDALARLSDNVVKGFPDPGKVIQDLKGKRTSPIHNYSLFNTNTKEEWEEAMSLLAG